MTRLIKYRTEQAAVTAIALEPGRLYTRLIFIDAPIRLTKVANGDVERYARDYEPRRPTLKAAARRMLRAGKKLGITKAARKALREVVTK